MECSDDSSLLRQYLYKRSEEAFRELVNRYLPLVYSAAFRQLGDAHRAQDAAQTVFIDLSRKAPKLLKRSSLAGWLYQATRYQTSNMIRNDSKRQCREQESVLLEEASQDSDWIWDKLLPVLDSAMQELRRIDRDALILRYFQRKGFREVGQDLGLSEDAAQKRVSRAICSLRKILNQRGVTLPISALSIGLTQQVTQAVPPGLATTICSTALTQWPAITASTATLNTVNIMTWSKLKFGILTGVITAAAITTTIVQHQALMRSKQENLKLAHQVEHAKTSLGNIQEQLDANQLTKEKLKLESDELIGLRAEVAKLRRDKTELDRKVQLYEESNQSPPDQTPMVESEAEKQNWEQYGQMVGNYRNRSFQGGEPLSEEEEQWLRDLKGELRELELNPQNFAEFQTGLIAKAVRVEDPSKLTAIREIIQDTYEKAVASGYDLMSKPTKDAEAWAKGRFQLDRQGTQLVQDLLSERERKAFDRQFIGIMGIDLGAGSVDITDYPEGTIMTIDVGGQSSEEADGLSSK